MVFNKLRKSEYFFITAGLTWLFVVCLGLWIIFQYENFPGTAGSPPNVWPSDSNIELSKKLPTLVLFAHPKCPCTRATINELTAIITKCNNKVKTCVVFYKPSGYPNKWAKTDTWYKVLNVPGVVVISDDGGKEVKRFHAETSGHTLLYNTNGELLFSGGITNTRGHEGNNIGREAIISLLTTGKTNLKTNKIFGCPILEEEK